MYTSNKPGAVPCACTTVKKLSRILGRTYDAALTDSGINITQLAVLRCISRRVDEPLAHVADELEMDRTSLYRALTPMVRDGWLTIANGSDARSRTAKLTEKGVQLLTDAGDGWDQAQHRLIESFGQDAYNSLIQELHRLATCAEQTAPG